MEIVDNTTFVTTATMGDVPKIKKIRLKKEAYPKMCGNRAMYRGRYS